jgi:hypothetical protein
MARKFRHWTRVFYPNLFPLKYFALPVFSSQLLFQPVALAIIRVPNSIVA